MWMYSLKMTFRNQVCKKNLGYCHLNIPKAPKRPKWNQVLPYTFIGDHAS